VEVGQPVRTRHHYAQGKVHRGVSASLLSPATTDLVWSRDVIGNHSAKDRGRTVWRQTDHRDGAISLGMAAWTALIEDCPR
jgi:hypothetical protein